MLHAAVTACMCDNAASDDCVCNSHFTWTGLLRLHVRVEPEFDPAHGVRSNPVMEMQNEPVATKRLQLYWRSQWTKLSRRSCLGQYVM